MARRYTKKKKLETIEVEEAKIVVHIILGTPELESGRPLCKFVDRHPIHWPRGHQWTHLTDLSNVTCPNCVVLREEQKQFPVRQQFVNKNQPIFLVGFQKSSDSDVFALAEVSGWLGKNNYQLLAGKIDQKEYEIYNMHTIPEKGDVLDPMHRTPSLVVAFHLFGINKIPSPQHEDGNYFYNRKNGYLLRDCLICETMLICFGDQPWLADRPFIKRKIVDNLHVYTLV